MPLNEQELRGRLLCLSELQTLNLGDIKAFYLQQQADQQAEQNA